MVLLAHPVILTDTYPLRQKNTTLNLLIGKYYIYLLPDKNVYFVVKTALGGDNERKRRMAGKKLRRTLLRLRA